MSNIVSVKMADYNTAKSPDSLVTLGIGSCVAVCLYSQAKKLGGLAHIMLPENRKNDQTASGKYADTAIEELIRLMLRHGASNPGLVAKVVGGGCVLNPSLSSTDTIGKHNTNAVKRILSDHSIRIMAEDIGGIYGRAVLFRAETGAVEVTILEQPARRVVL